MHYNAYLQWRLIPMYFTYRSWYRSWILNLLTPVVRSSRLAWPLTSDSLFFCFQTLKHVFAQCCDGVLLWFGRSNHLTTYQPTLLSEKGPAEKRNFGRKQGSCLKRGWARPGFTPITWDNVDPNLTRCGHNISHDQPEFWLTRYSLCFQNSFTSYPACNSFHDIKVFLFFFIERDRKISGYLGFTEMHSPFEWTGPVSLLIDIYIFF